MIYAPVALVEQESLALPPLPPTAAVPAAAGAVAELRQPQLVAREVGQSEGFQTALLVYADCRRQFSSGQHIV